jgi:hypothetical protein
MHLFEAAEAGSKLMGGEEGPFGEMVKAKRREMEQKDKEYEGMLAYLDWCEILIADHREKIEELKEKEKANEKRGDGVEAMVEETANLKLSED